MTNPHTDELLAAAKAALYAIQILEVDDRFVDDFFECGGRLMTAIQRFEAPTQHTPRDDGMPSFRDVDSEWRKP